MVQLIVIFIVVYRCQLQLVQLIVSGSVMCILPLLVAGTIDCYVRLLYILPLLVAGAIDCPSVRLLCILSLVIFYLLLSCNWLRCRWHGVSIDGVIIALLTRYFRVIIACCEGI